MASPSPSSEPVASPSSPSAGPSTSASTASQVAAASEEDLDFKVYAPSDIQTLPLAPLEDAYFTPSAAEIQLAQATLTARTNALVNAPLLVRSKREEIEAAKRGRWPNTVIRIRFTDRTQLEKTFPSTNKIRTVYAFVRGCLRDDAKAVKFVLYQTPPKREFRVSDLKVRDCTLAELQLAPASILLLKFEGDDSMNKTDYPAPLLPSILSRMTALPIPHQQAETAQPSKDGEDAKGKGKTVSGGTLNKAEKEKKLMKWMKLGKK